MLILLSRTIKKSTAEIQESKDLISILRFENLLKKLDVDLKTTQFVVRNFTKENLS